MINITTNLEFLLLLACNFLMKNFCLHKTITWTLFSPIFRFAVMSAQFFLKFVLTSLVFISWLKFLFWFPLSWKSSIRFTWLFSVHWSDHSLSARVWNYSCGLLLMNSWWLQLFEHWPITIRYLSKQQCKINMAWIATC